MSFRLLIAAVVAAGIASGVAAAADTPVTIALTLKDHRFTPSAITLPAGAKVRIALTNLDPATEEFDSHDLRVEQLVTPHGQTTFTIGPLRPGAYNFMGEFHPATAQGRVTVPEVPR